MKTMTGQLWFHTRELRITNEIASVVDGQPASA